MSELNDFKEYVLEQQHLCYGVELGGTPAVVGSLARQYDFLIETIETYQEIEQSKLNSNQKVVLELLQKAYAKNKWMTPFGAVFSVANENDFAIRAWLNKEEQFKVLAVFMEWGMENAYRNEEK